MTKIKIKRDGEEFGPYEPDTVQTYLSKGNLSKTDLACWEGQVQWMPLARLLATPPPPPPSHSAAAPLPFVPRTFAVDPTGNTSLDAPTAETAHPSPPPPSLHWSLVFIFGLLSGMLVWLVWPFIQSTFVKKIDPLSKATRRYAFGMGCFGIAITIGGSADQLLKDGVLSETTYVPVAVVAWIFLISAVTLLYKAIFGVRSSLQRYYRDVEPIGRTSTGEPIGIRISGLAIAIPLFNVLYIQHHLTRIAKWKQTGASPY